MSKKTEKTDDQEIDISGFVEKVEPSEIPSIKSRQSKVYEGIYTKFSQSSDRCWKIKNFGGKLSRNISWGFHRYFEKNGIEEVKEMTRNGEVFLVKL